MSRLMGFTTDEERREASQKMNAALRAWTGFGPSEDAAASEDTEVEPSPSGRGFDQGARGGHSVEREEGPGAAFNRVIRERVGIVPADNDGVPQGATVEA